ncbi:MAG: hypothetical protein WBP79_16050 [Candidatus Acidiferrales bacterium]
MKAARIVGMFLLAALILSIGLFHKIGCAGAAPTQSDRPGDAFALTIYNQQFAVVRQILNLNLKPGVNHFDANDLTGHLEPDSVILRPLDAGRRLQILEQNYRNDPVTAQLLLSLYEGKTLEFTSTDRDGSQRIVKGKVIRSGFVSHSSAYTTYGQQYASAQMNYVQSGGDQPVIEVDGKIQFSLPGQPIFPALADDTILKPTLSWELESDKGGAIPAEFSYVTGGMMWNAAYNIVAPPKGNVLELVGWVTLDNQSGKTFRDARIKLMAGDVNKMQPGMPMAYARKAAMVMENDAAMAPPVTERAFDEYHLYTLERATTLRDRETKQVEFVRGAGIQSQTVYVYDGLRIDQNYNGWSMENIRAQEAFGTRSNSKVWVMQEFKNSSDNHLGMPLPKGRVRFYRRDEDGQLEFTGENEIDHTPKDEMIRLYTGNAFDMAGERRRTEYRMDSSGHWVNETFEIKVRNHKSTPIEVRVVEHLYRWTNWDITMNSDAFKKLDSQTIAFTVQIPRDGEKTVRYQVHYSW